MVSAAARVLILGMHYRPEVTGNAPYTSGLAEALANDGVDVTVICSHPHYPQWKIHPGYGSWASRERIANVDVRRLRHWVPPNPRSLQRLLSEVSFGLRQLFARWDRPEVVLLVSPALFSTAIALIRAKVTGARVVVWVQDVYSTGLREIGAGPDRVAAVVRWIEAQTLRRADAVAIIHESFRRSVEADLGVDPGRISVIRNWSHVQESDGGRSGEIRAKHGWSPDTLVALHAGNQGIKQGLENLVDVARLVDATGSRIRIVLLGGGNQHERLRRLADGIDSIQFVDAVGNEDFVDTLNAADVLVVNERPGVAEMSVPSKLTSYFAAGRPVVAACAGHGGTAAEIESAAAGIRVEPGRPAALLDALRRLQDDPEAGRSMGSAGQQYRRQTLTEEASVSQFAALLGVSEARRPPTT